MSERFLSRAQEPDPSEATEESTEIPGAPLLSANVESLSIDQRARLQEIVSRRITTCYRLFDDSTAELAHLDRALASIIEDFRNRSITHEETMHRNALVEARRQPIARRRALILDKIKELLEFERKLAQ